MRLVILNFVMKGAYAVTKCLGIIKLVTREQYREK